MICQLCATPNPDDEVHCAKCGHKLLVVSGPYTEDDQDTFDADPDEAVSFDEHLLERISILEEVVRRTTDMVRHSLGTLYKLEQKILINDVGVTTLRDLLEEKRVVRRREWSELWESRLDHQLLALEKRERFARSRESIAELYSGEHRDTFHSLLDDAERSLLALDMDSALELLSAAHQLDPANHELSFFLGETSFNEGRADDALAYFSRVLEAKPQHFGSLLYGGVLCHELGRDDDAMGLLSAAVEVYPDSFLPTFALGAVHAEHERFDDAVALLETALDAGAGETLPQASFLLGNCYHRLGRPGLATRHLESAVHQDPDLAEAHQLLGQVYLDRGWTKKALDALEIADALRPPHLDYAELIQLLGPQMDGSLPEVDGDAVPWLSQAEDALRDGRGRQALSAYRQAMAHDPENPTLLVAYAMACLTVGRTDEIEGVVEAALERTDDDRLEAAAHALLVEMLRAEGRSREARRLAERCLERAPSDFGLALARFELAASLVTHGERGRPRDEEPAELFRRAEDCAVRAAESDVEPIRRLALDCLGWVCFRQRALDQAIDCLTRANGLGSSSRTLDHLAIV
ncbi:MAG: tetratricopeptide repeat protein, partial [Acidobacteriota bacterium]